MLVDVHVFGLSQFPVVPGAWRRPVETDTSISGISSACRLFGRMKIAQMEEKKAATDFKNDSLRQKKVQKAEYGKHLHVILFFSRSVVILPAFS